MSCDLGLEALADISPKWEIRAPPNLKIKIEVFFCFNFLSKTDFFFNAYSLLFFFDKLDNPWT